MKCFECKRRMARSECGDELPEERICDFCAGLVPLVKRGQTIKVFDFHTSKNIFCKVTAQPWKDDDRWRINIRISKNKNRTGGLWSADWDEDHKRWELSEA